MCKQTFTVVGGGSTGGRCSVESVILDQAALSRGGQLLSYHQIIQCCDGKSGAGIIILLGLANETVLALALGWHVNDDPGCMWRWRG